MSKPGNRSILYRLIEAGQLTHKAVLVPLLARGLEPGDDAILFLLASKKGTTEQQLLEGSGLSPDALAPRLNRLVERELVTRTAIGPALLPGVVLTRRGDRIRQVLTGTWKELESALLGGLPKSRRKGVRKALNRFVDLLRP